MTTERDQARNARNEAADKVAAWWHAGTLNGEMRDHTKAPAWPEYLAAFAAHDREVEKEGLNGDRV